MLNPLIPRKGPLARIAFELGEAEFDHSSWNICHGKGSSGGGGTNTVTSSAPPPQVMAAYQTAQNAAQQAASAPLQQYGGPTIAGFTPDQLQAFQTTAGTAGAYNPYLQTANQNIQAGTAPLWSSVPQFSAANVNQYQSPYTQDVVGATEAQFNNQNAIQQNGVVGNAISQGAWGGDRSAVAQALTAGQEQLAQAPVIAGLENTGYTQALGEFNNQQQQNLSANEANAYLNEQAGFGQGNLASLATSLPLEQASAQAAAGAQQQNLGQEALNVPYEQFLQQQAYPFQTAQYFANIAEGLGPGQGQTGTGTTTTPGPSTASQIGGGLLGAASIAAMFLAKGGRIKRDSGGLIPDFSASIVPTTQSPGGRSLTLPQAPVVPASQDTNGNLMSSLEEMAIKKGIGNYLNNPKSPQAGLSPDAGSVWASGTNNGQSFGDIAQMAEQVGANANFLGASAPDMGISFKNGGRAHYDGGGMISPVSGPQAAPYDATAMQQNAYQQISQMPMDKLQELQIRFPASTPQGMMIQKAIKQKQFMPSGQPQAGLQAPQASPQAVNPLQAQQGAAAGGRQHLDDGGVPTPPTPDEIELQQEVAAEPQSGLGNVAQFPGTYNPPSSNTQTVSGYQPPPPSNENAKVSPWEALATAGFGMMAGTSPYAGVNIGRGALAGIQNFEEQKKQTATQNYQQGELGIRGQEANQTGEYQKGELAARARTADQEADKLVAQIDQWHHENEQKNTITPYEQAQLDLEQKKVDQGKYTVGKNPITGEMTAFNSKTGEFVKPPQGQSGSAQPFIDPDTGEIVSGGAPQNPSFGANLSGVTPTVYHQMATEDSKQRQAALNNMPLAANILNTLDAMEPNFTKVDTGGYSAPVERGAAKLFNPNGQYATSAANLDKGTNALATDLQKFQYTPGQRGSVSGLQTILASKPGMDQPLQTNQNITSEIRSRVTDYMLTQELAQQYRQSSPLKITDSNTYAVDDALKTIYPLQTVDPKTGEVTFNKDNAQKIKQAIPDAIAHPQKYLSMAEKGGSQSQAAPPVPQSLMGMSGLQFSPKRQQYRDGSGNVYDMTGNRVQ